MCKDWPPFTLQSHLIPLHIFNQFSGSGEIIAPSQVIFSDSLALKVRNGGIDVIVPVNDPKGKSITCDFPQTLLL